MVVKYIRIFSNYGVGKVQCSLWLYFSIEKQLKKWAANIEEEEKNETLKGKICSKKQI